MSGVATAPDSSVDVNSQAALPGVVFKWRGRSAMTGTSRVCRTATMMPAKASTGTIALGAVWGDGSMDVGVLILVCVMAQGLQFRSKQREFSDRAARGRLTRARSGYGVGSRRVSRVRRR